MPKITMIGAGSAGFCKMLVQDIVSYDSLKESEIVLMDVDESRLNTTYKVMNKIKEQNNLKCMFSATTDLRKALNKADFAISVIQVGGLEPYKYDIEIPLKHGIDQCVGDTINPGGVFRGLRHVPALFEMLRVMEEVAPEIIFMNYANPMAICSWAMQKEFPHISSVGLCHGVQHTTDLLCKWLGLEYDDVDILTAGINHMSWFLKFQHAGKDMYPIMWKKLEEEGPIKGEEYRFEMMKAIGYFMTETSGHLSEYLPYFRKRKDLQDLFAGPGFSGETGAYLRMCNEGYENYKKEMADYANGVMPVPFEPTQKSFEFASKIMDSKITNNITKFAGNTLNKNFITNLPFDSCVEVPIFVDRLGLHPSYVGELPSQCAALCRSNISVQELAVKAAIDGDPEAVFHACLLDPLTAAVLAPHEIRNMVEEMLESEAKWLPQFKGKKNCSPGNNIGRFKTGITSLPEGVKVISKIGHYD